MTPIMAMTNWTRSDASTPHRPEIAANATQITLHTSTVWSRSQPSMTLAILAAARVTEAMIAQLKKNPR